MGVNMDKQKIKSIVRAYDDGVTLEAISILFKVEQKELINIIYIIKVARRKYYEKD